MPVEKTRDEVFVAAIADAGGWAMPARVSSLTAVRVCSTSFVSVCTVVAVRFLMPGARASASNDDGASGIGACASQVRDVSA
jgi:hypothetical protein